MLSYFRNRETMGYLVGSFLLFLVIVAFIAFYIPDFMGPGSAAADTEVARVQGRSISSRAFLESYRRLERSYRAQLGDRYSPALMQQLGLPQAALQELIQEQALLVEAERQGLTVSDEEVGQAVLSDPTFQSDGTFIGRDAYLQLLAANGLSATQYEQRLRQQLLTEKLRTLVSESLLVDPKDVEEEYRRRNEKALVEYLVVGYAEFEKDIQPSDDEVGVHFEAHREDYRHPVQRKLAYLGFTPDLFAASVKVEDREIQRYYADNPEVYETEDQVRASHILFKTDGKNEGEARARAEAVLSRVRAGEDFAELAKSHSEDTSADQGGDLGFFGRGDMVPEFEQAAFALEPDELSDLVRSTYGFHIIKVTGRQPGATRPLEMVKEQIRSVLVGEKSRAAMGRAVKAAAAELGRTGNLDALAQRHHLTLQETPWFGRAESLPQLGPEVVRQAFETAVGETADAAATARGYLFFRVIQERPAGVPALDEVQERARADLRRERALELARKRTEELHRQLTARPVADLAAAAAALGLELKRSENHTRRMELPGVGRSSAVERTAFTLAPGILSDPLPGSEGWVLLRVVERSGYSAEAFASEKSRFAEQLRSERRNQLWSSFLQDLQRRLDIQIYGETVQNLIG